MRRKNITANFANFAQAGIGFCEDGEESATNVAIRQCRAHCITPSKLLLVNRIARAAGDFTTNPYHPRIGDAVATVSWHLVTHALGTIPRQAHPDPGIHATLEWRPGYFFTHGSTFKESPVSTATTSM